jgi:hypothetical protein
MSTELRLEFPTPSPEMLAMQPWRADPRWLNARKWRLADIPGETAADGLVRGVRGLYEMYLIEVEYQSQNSALAAMRSFREDPRWLQARADYTDEREGEDPDAKYVRCVKAAARMHDIEKEYKSRTSTT